VGGWGWDCVNKQVVRGPRKSTKIASGRKKGKCPTGTFPEPQTWGEIWQRSSGIKREVTEKNEFLKLKLNASSKTFL